MDVLLGAQWGDEGKGKVVDVIAADYQVIARFQGGPNAGHTLWIDGRKHVLHTIPSGVFRPETTNLVGNGVVIDPIIFLKEFEAIRDLAPDIHDRLLISRRAHLILPTHRLLDAASEAEKGDERIGSTLKGIGPTYMDKTGRNGLRVGDLERSDLMDRFRSLVKKHYRLLGLYGTQELTKEAEQEWLEAVRKLRELKLVDSEHVLENAFRAGRRVLAEGAQGTLLDIDFGTYPYVTSSNTVCAGACTGLGVPPTRIGRVIGIFKAYSTRVGSGPFPTELHDEVGERIRRSGNEFGSTTGRPRRCGWLDLPALRYAVMINGITELALMKSDVLSGLGQVGLCTAYEIGGQRTDHVPFDISDAHPVLEELPGWGELSTSGPLPDALERYIHRIEETVQVPVRIVSIGPERDQTLERSSALKEA
ncbi:MAG: adenylosuccinate synthase [Flavobacteriales bacterium]|nr:adenylosuccinate synthase [Flavobacteriales bacterium]MCB9193656.1 adenylosuccinate synthase [Flavobacteriales bacterium]